jgi:hypothetical protein
LYRFFHCQDEMSVPASVRDRAGARVFARTFDERDRLEVILEIFFPAIPCTVGRDGASRQADSLFAGSSISEMKLVA